MNDFKKEFNNLKKNINAENSSLAMFLIAGVLIGRFYEKISRFKKSIFKKLK